MERSNLAKRFFIAGWDREGGRGREGGRISKNPVSSTLPHPCIFLQQRILRKCERSLRGEEEVRCRGLLFFLALLAPKLLSCMQEMILLLTPGVFLHGSRFSRPGEQDASLLPPLPCTAGQSDGAKTVSAYTAGCSGPITHQLLIFPH
jgi:hypothetical protein